LTQGPATPGQAQQHPQPQQAPAQPPHGGDSGTGEVG
jgi:hypothetical protein